MFDRLLEIARVTQSVAMEEGRRERLAAEATAGAAGMLERARRFAAAVLGLNTPVQCETRGEDVRTGPCAFASACVCDR